MRINDKKITVIASDFDGTIIKHGMEAPSQRFYELVNECLERGIFFVAASGRQYSNLYRMLNCLHKDIAYICENGSLVMYQGRVIYKALIEEALAAELLTDMQLETGCDIMVSGEDTSYVLDKNPAFAAHVGEYIGNHCCVLQDFCQIQEPMIKISLYFPKGIPGDVAARYHEKYDGKLQIVDAGNDWFDFNPRESSKGHALQKLAEALGLCMDETVAFGDGENDISLLKAAGLSYAMNTAQIHVQAVADAICDTVENVICKIKE